MLITLDMVISGFVSKVVNNCWDFSKNKLRCVDKNRESNEQNIETRIYQVIIDALNKLTYDKFTEQDVLYDSAENILKGFKSSKNDIEESVRAGLKMLGLQSGTDTDKEFLRILCHEICKDENDILYKEIAMLQQEQMVEAMGKGFSESHQNEQKALKLLDEIKEDTRRVRGFLAGKGGNEAETYNEIHIANRTKEYADRWNKNVFLNDFNERDENAGVNIKLRELYLEEHLPQYIWKASQKPRNDLKDLLKEYIVDIANRRMLLILGQAGIGKSTLITWILSNLVEQKDQILVYQFASDLKNINWTEDNILNEIVKTIGLKHTELEGRTLILDGFDEISANGDKERILNKLNQELKVMNILQRFSLIINCRENYINQSDLGNIEYIILQAWNEEQIKSFCGNYEKKSARKNSEALKSNILEVKIRKLIENKAVFGIPLILYMVLALNVDIEETSSRVEIYDQIFSLKRGGIYDRCYDIEHRINAPEIKKHIHRISQRIAFWMFENNANEAVISQKEFEEICEIEMSESGKKGEEILRDALIGNFFKLKYCEGKETDEIQFVHRSIYEYYVAVYFFESIHKLTTKEEAAGKLGELLKYGILSEQILEFIKYKFDSVKGYSLSDNTKKIFNMMLQYGMTYYVKDKYKNIIVMELNIFANMLEVVHLWNPKLEKADNNIVLYLLHGGSLKLNLSGVDLSGAKLGKADLSEANLSEANLSRVDLTEANLSRANLSRANLSGADLDETDLSRADLSRADLSRAYLFGANLSGADLSGANLNRANLLAADLHIADLRGADLRKADLGQADLSIADLSGADLIEVGLEYADLFATVFDEKQADELCGKYDMNDSRVYIFKTDEIISYKEYCIRK